LGSDDERRCTRYESTLADRRDEQQQKHGEQQDQVQQPAQPIEAAPNSGHDPQRPRAIVIVHSPVP
jgi:hypothetical protein